MLFNSLTYLTFLALVVVLYWNVGRAARIWLLLITSLIFYGFWRWEYIPVMLASVIINYVAALRIHAATQSHIRRFWLLIALLGNLGMLFYFKYTLFFVENLSDVVAYFGQEPFSLPWMIVLPIGISFYTFQSISYTVDVYRNYIRPSRDFPLFATYVTFFPQLIAGPVLRAREVIPQLNHRPNFNIEDLSQGGRLILSGLFLKVVLADNLAPIVDTAFLTPTATLSALDVWVMSFLFGFQIYFDFSAYSQIAIGSARLMGIHFPRNFDFPYLAQSPSDFWKRWHISLSSWIRDYLYLPLAGIMPRDDSKGGLSIAVEATRVSQTRSVLALIITWVLMGFWHGASWSFVLWGLWHCLLILLYRVMRHLGPFKATKFRFWGWFFTLPLMMLGWIPFRAARVEDAVEMMMKVANPSAYLNLDQISSGYIWAVLPINIDPSSYLLVAILMIGMLLCWAFKVYIWEKLNSHAVLRTVALAILMSLQTATVFIYLRPVQQFIYFQF